MKVLIVEDEMLLALEMETELEIAGHDVVGTAMSRKQAERLIDDADPHFAFVDIHLADGPTGIEVGRRLADRAIPFVFVTGNLRRIPQDFAGAIGAIEKPYTMTGLENAIRFLEHYIEGKTDVSLAPPSLILAPFATEA